MVKLTVSQERMDELREVLHYLTDAVEHTPKLKEVIHSDIVKLAKRLDEWLFFEGGRPSILDKITKILAEEDIMRLIKMDCPKDEYSGEAETILERLDTCKSQKDVQRIVHRAFSSWFYPLKVGKPEHYAKIARRVWMVWVKRAA